MPVPTALWWGSIQWMVHDLIWTSGEDAFEVPGFSSAMGKIKLHYFFSRRSASKGTLPHRAADPYGTCDTTPAERELHLRV